MYAKKTGDIQYIQHAISKKLSHICCKKYSPINICHEHIMKMSIIIIFEYISSQKRSVFLIP